MQSNTARILVGIGSVVAVVVLLVVFAGGGDDEEDGTKAAATAPAETTSTGTTTAEAAERGGEGEGSQEPPPPQIETIAVEGGEPTGGVAELDYSKGEQVRFAVRSDAADEIHVHGYDIEKELEPGKRTVVAFPADIDGVFEIELHGTGTEIAQLTVNP